MVMSSLKLIHEPLIVHNPNPVQFHLSYTYRRTWCTGPGRIELRLAALTQNPRCMRDYSSEFHLVYGR